MYGNSTHKIHKLHTALTHEVLQSIREEDDSQKNSNWHTEKTLLTIQTFINFY